MSDTINNNEKVVKKVRGKPFVKGVVTNPNGRPKGSLNKATQFQQELYAALEMFKKDNNISFLDHFVKRAGKSDTVAVALSKKILPDKVEQENTGETKIVIVRAEEDKNV